MDDQRTDREGDGVKPKRSFGRRLFETAVLLFFGCVFLFCCEFPVVVEYPDSPPDTFADGVLRLLWLASGPLIGAALFHPFKMWPAGALLGFIAEIAFVFWFAMKLADGLGGI